MKKLLIFLGIFAALIGGGLFFFIGVDSVSTEQAAGGTLVNSIAQVKTEKTRPSVPLVETLSQPENSEKNDLLAISKVSFENKLARERELDSKLAAENLSETIKQIIIEMKSKGVELPEHLLKKLESNELSPSDFAEIKNYVDKALPPGEAEFRKKMLGYGMSYAELKTAYTERSLITGINYDQEMINNASIYKEITYNELKTFLNKGNRLPSNIVTALAGAQRIDLLESLYGDGYVTELDYVNPYTHRNALEDFVDGYINSPKDMSANQAIKAIDMILHLGVNPVPQDGTRDALDYALGNISDSNAESIALISKKLIESGVGFQNSHIYLLQKFKIDFPKIYDQYFQSYFDQYSTNP